MLARFIRALPGRIPGPKIVILGCALLVLGCTEEPRAHVGSGQYGRAVAEPCEQGEQRTCSETISQQSGILSCYHGVQWCDGGIWGECQNGQVTRQADWRGSSPDQGEFRKLALSEATGCVDNPCDPKCQVFVEDPPDITGMGGMGSDATTFADGPPPDWSTGAGVAPCAHGLCSEGTALDSSCHACARRVCDVDPTCCSDTGGANWDADCVALSHTECAGKTAQPPIPENHACNYAVFALDRARMVNSGSVTGGSVGTNASGAPAQIDIGGAGMSIERVVSAGDVQIDGGATVIGGVTTEGTINNTGTVGGVGEESGVTFPPLTLPTRPVDCVNAQTSYTASAGTTVPDGDVRVFQPTGGAATFEFEAPGRFGGFYANGQTARLVFKQPGTYTFSKFTLNHGSSFTIEVPDEGDVIIENCGDSDATFFVGGGQFELYGTLNVVQSSGGPIDPHQLQIYTNFHDSIPISASSIQGLSLIAPRARVYSAGATGDAHGLIWAREVDLVTDVDLSAAGYTGEACLQAGLLAPAIQACPVSLEVPPMPPPRSPGCLSGEDCQVNSRCTDVTTAASCDHSKCAVGDALDGACRLADPCVDRICAVDASCCEQSNGWTCLPGNRCVAAECGDGLIRGLEACDDGNPVSGDGCSSTCQVESGFICEGEPSSCRVTVCGDGILEGDEDCDDGGLAPWDGCSETCALEPSCPPQGGACSSQCGDGMTLAGDAEECDDGNLIDGDGCSSSCTIETGFSCAPQVASTDPFIDMPVVYRDFANRGANRHPDFEHFTGLPLTRGLVENTLGVDGLPVYTGLCEEGQPITVVDCPNMGYFDGWNPVSTGYMTTGQSNFDEWFRSSTRSYAYWDSVRLIHTGSEYQFNPGDNFYPLSSRPQPLLGDGHTRASTGNWENFGFTSEVRSWFVYRGGEELYFEGDDDVWVFINGQLALDLGGLHQKTAGRLLLGGTGALEEWWDPSPPYPGAPNPAPAWPGVYHSTSRNLGLTVGNAYEIALFHAERRSEQSNFTLTLTGFFDEPSACQPICGDGVVVPGEVCDDGAQNGEPGTCEVGCQGWDAGGSVSGTWGPHCVDMVKTECDAWCGETTTSDCGHGACEVGQSLDESCSSCAAEVCAFPGLSHCCDPSGSWDEACIKMANRVCTTPEGRACGYSVLSNGTVHVETFSVHGGLTGGRDVAVANGPEGAGHTEDIFAQGSVDVQAGGTGNIVAGGAITQTGGNTGSQSPFQTVPRFQITKRTFACGGTGTTSVSSTSPLTIGPGTYESLRVDANATLTLSAPGDYYINRLEVVGQARLILPDSGNVNIHICEDLLFVGWGWPTTVGPEMRLASGGLPNGADASRFRFFINGTGGSTIANWANFWGMVFLPHSGIYVGSRAWVHGVVHAEGDVTTNWHGHIDGTGVVGSTCLAAQIVDGQEQPESSCDYAMVGAGSMTVIGGTVRGGNVSAGGALSVDPLTTHCEPPAGGLCSYTPAIEGNVSTAGAFAGCSYVSGTCESNLGVAHSVPTIRTRSFSCPAPGAGLTIYTGDPFPPGDYGAVTVPSGEIVAWEQGTYRIASLTIEDNSTIALPSAGTVELDVCGRVAVGSGVFTAGVSNSTDALRFQIYSASTDHDPSDRRENAIYVGTATNLYATLTAPLGAVVIDEWADVFGFVHASEGTVLSGAVLDATGVTGTNCAYNPNFGTCSAINIESGSTSIDDAGVCMENGDSFLDTSCSGIDLAVDFGCSEHVPVCNHGTVDAPAGVELTFYPRAGHQFAASSPDPSWSVGTCTVNQAIPSGTCVSQACDPSLTDSDVTVMVNVNEAVPECSLLDNWSLKDPTEVCPPSGGGASMVERTEVYQAVCPVDSRPVWGLFTWNSQTPAASEITFDARIAGSESGLSSEMYTRIGTAQQNPNDTQSCSYLSATPECPVDVMAFLPDSSDAYSTTVDTMSSATHTVSFLELRMTLLPDAAQSPILEDWNLTYSCIYDQ